MSHERIGVALDQHRHTGLADGRLGLVDEEEGAALVEEQGLGRVQVLGAGVLALRPQDAAGHAGRTTGGIADGEDDAGAETVVDATAGATPAGQAGCLEVRLGDLALAAERAGQGVPGVRRPAQAEGLDGLIAEAAIVQVGQR